MAAFCRCREVTIDAAHSSPAAYLFVEDEGRILRYALQAERMRVGRDVSNDIWIDHPAVRSHALMVYLRDGQHHLKVFEGAKVSLNGAPVAGIHRLYGGDRLGVAEREFLYGRDDTPAEVALGLTVLRDGAVQHALVLRRTVTTIARRDADLVLDHPSVEGQHWALECYGSDAFFLHDRSVQASDGSDRRRIGDGALLRVGVFAIRVHVLPSDAHGLLLATARPEKSAVPHGAPPPMDRSPGQRRDPGAQSARQRVADNRPVEGGFIRPVDALNAGSEAPKSPPPLPEPPPAPVAVTEIASLAQLQGAQDSRPPPVRVKPEVMAAVDTEPLPRWAEAPPPLPSSPRLHEQDTQMLDTDAIAARMAGQPPPLAQPIAQRSAPLTQVLDTGKPPSLLVRAPRKEAAPIARPALRPDAVPPPLPREADPSMRRSSQVVVDSSRRDFDATHTQHDKPKP